jgi:thiol-disulfide isomerase/thioredoxin
MKPCALFSLVMALVVSSFALDDAEGPTNAKATKTYQEAFEYLHQRANGAALEAFKKADKQDDGHCLGCQKKMIKYGMELQDWKAAETGGEEMVSEAKPGKDIAIAHYHLAIVWMREGLDRHKGDLFTRAHEEMTQALAAASNFPDAVFADGQILAHMNQDDAAKAQFEQFVKMKSVDELTRQRALRYIGEPELARARMAPPFSVTTMDGQSISLDELRGKVVLIDFWATWCPSCREALPHIQKIAKKFQGEPLVILSVSLDEDEQKWKDFVAKNEMSWSQYRDANFKGALATSFAVHAIPQTFTIDADGVLQDQHIGDEAIEGKLKKLVGRAHELQLAQAQKQVETQRQ